VKCSTTDWVRAQACNPAEPGAQATGVASSHIRSTGTGPCARRCHCATVKMTGSLIVFASVLMPTGFTLAQTHDDSQVPEVHPLASKEEMIRDRFQRFEDRVYRLREQLGDGESQNASRLGRVLQRAGELGLGDRLDEIIELLHDHSLLNEAVDTQSKWLADADHLLAILLTRDGENLERKKGLDRLKAYSETLKEILEQQRALRDDTGRASMMGRMIEQQKVADKTGDLSAQMQEDAAAGGQQDQPGERGAQGAQGESYPPGQQNVDRAQQEMEDAAEALGQSNPQRAAPSQDRAIQQLEQAQKELEDALNQLRQEEREETLRDLESRFRKMLSKQRAINESTFRLYQAGRENFKRAEHLQLADLSAQERALSENAALCLHILDEDATTIVFPRVVGQLSEDMAAVADRLGAYQVGKLTQTIEREIVETLEQLLEVVQHMQQENEQQMTPGETGGDSQARLLPQSAELKLLRASQLSINTRTAAIEEDARKLKRQDIETDVDEDLVEAFRAVAVRQRECAEIAKEMHNLQHQP